MVWWSAVGEYEGRLKEMIHALKYERRRSIAPPLGALMRECSAPLLDQADIVVPVPLHPRRAYQRGFNQADDLARQLGLPVMHLLQRTRHTQSQIELPKHQREENVKGAFALTNGTPLVPNPQSLITDGCIIVLVDDVSTTGATLDACARVLKAAGASEVRAVTAARVASQPRR